MHKLAKRGADIAVECWRLDAAGKTAAFACFDGGVPALIHFGRQLPGDENLEQLARLTMPNIAGGQLDPVVPLTLVPTALDGWQGHPGIIIRGPDGRTVEPVWQSTELVSEANNHLRWTIDENGDEVRFTLVLEVRFDPTGVMAIESAYKSVEGYRVEWFSCAAIPVPIYLPRIIDHGGRWTGEFQRQERTLTLGQHVRESREGRTGHAHFPGMIFASNACDETSGECMGVTIPWSGGHRIIAEETPDGRRHVQTGFDTRSLKITRKSYVGWSADGLNGLSHMFVNVVRSRLPKKVARPVHYNCWEAVYFRHSVAELKEIASIAAEHGAERFVLDDGWFKGRNDDTTSLGDWVVDNEKYPDGLKPLTDHVTALGMEFGIWFEPEMVNTESDLYRNHPEWVLGPASQPSGRGQFVLDLANPAVSEYLFDAMSAILNEYPVRYIKWDHNRKLSGGVSEQTGALYRLLQRLNDTFPDLEIESCASGGGRVDYGMLRHATRVWLSDSNDALERLRMQHEASRWLPVEVQGSHVGPRHCHTSGRVLSMHFRAWVAAQRHMGFEMDPRELTNEESRTLKNVTQWYKDRRDFLHSAKHLRLDCEDPEVFAEMFVDEAGDQFVTFIGQSGASAQIASDPIRLAGLDPFASYEVNMADTESVPPVLNRNSAFGLAPSQLSGAALMAGAFRYPNLFPASMLVYEGNRVERQV
ncbi:MAG: alpha-galactosidase [Pseudomonadota bacterium]